MAAGAFMTGLLSAGGRSIAFAFVCGADNVQRMANTQGKNGARKGGRKTGGSSR